MADSNRLQKITIHWSYPRKLENIETDWKYKTNVLYYISRIFAGKESPIYLGETTRDCITRIDEHYKKKSKFFKKRGEKYLRVGTIVKPQSLSSYNGDNEIEHLLQIIESRLVENLNQRNLGRYLCNKRQASSFTEWYKLDIENTGYRGYFPKNLQFIEY